MEQENPLPRLSSPSLAVWRAIVADAHSTDRAHLIQLLSHHEHEISIVGEAASLIEAEYLCIKLSPDIIFLSTELQNASGLDLLPKLKRLPGIIFMSREADTAIQAIEVGAVDYLLKPVSTRRLALSLARLRCWVPDSSTLPVPRPLYMVDVMIIPLHRGYRVVPTRSIVSLRSDANYSTLNLSDGQELYIYRGLNQWEAHLPIEGFLRLDRSFIIAPGHIRNLEVANRESALLFISNGNAPIKIGRTALGRLKNHFGAAHLSSLPKRIFME